MESNWHTTQDKVSWEKIDSKARKEKKYPYPFLRAGPMLVFQGEVDTVLGD